MIVGYASGVWDMFHIGHLNILQRAAEHCDHLIAGVVTDEETLRTKGRAPVVPEQERLAIVGALRCVDETIIDPSLDKRIVWSMRRFDVMFKGDDWRGTEAGARLEAQLAEVGATVHYFPYTVHTSSTALRRYLDGA